MQLLLLFFFAFLSDWNVNKNILSVIINEDYSFKLFTGFPPPINDAYFTLFGDDHELFTIDGILIINQMKW